MRGYTMNIKKLIATVLIVVGAISTASANDIESIKNNLKVEFFGNYISPDSKVSTSWGTHYYLPSDIFQRRNKSENKQIEKEKNQREKDGFTRIKKAPFVVARV